MPKQLVELEIDELSLVDKAANRMKFVVLKRNGSVNKNIGLGALIAGAQDNPAAGFFMSDEELAAKLPITVDQLKTLKAGGPVAITQELIDALAAALGLSVEDVAAVAKPAAEAAVEEAQAVIAETEAVGDAPADGEPVDVTPAPEPAPEPEAAPESPAEEVTGSFHEEDEDEDVNKAEHLMTEEDVATLNSAITILQRVVNAETDDAETSESSDDDVEKMAVRIIKQANDVRNDENATPEQIQSAQDSVNAVNKIIHSL